MTDKKRYYWLKLKDDFFDEKYIKALRKLPDGDLLTIIYLKLQLKSLKTEGIIKYDHILPSKEEELALMLDEDINAIKLTIESLTRIGIIELWDDDTLYMSAMQELIGSEASSTERVRKHRENKKMLQCNTDETNCNTEKEIDIEKDKSKDKKTYKDTKTDKDTKEENKLSDKSLECEFEELWKLYPNKKSKRDALKHYKASRRRGTTKEEVLNGIYAFLDYIRLEKINTRYIKHGSTWFNQECWNDDYSLRGKKTLKDISMEEIDEAIRLERERGGNNL